MSGTIHKHFFVAVVRQVKMKGYVPDLESYIEMRRNTSCYKPCFQLIEYVGGFTLPDDVVEVPVIQDDFIRSNVRELRPFGSCI